LVAWSTLVVAGGCGQILGLSDYEVDPSLGAGAPATSPRAARRAAAARTRKPVNPTLRTAASQRSAKAATGK